MAPSTVTALAASVLLGTLDVAGANQVHRQALRSGQKHGEAPLSMEPAGGFVHALEFKHSLRVCNAFPYAAALTISRGKSELLTGDEAMPYKACRDFQAHLAPGDKLEFKIGDVGAGTFSVSDLPNSDAVLLLVVHRHDTLSMAVAFESHVFASTGTAQVAVIDTYKGAKRSMPKIMDATPPPADAAGKPKVALTARSEDLRFDSVVAVNPGIYEVALDATDGSAKSTQQLVALRRESYVVMRTGVESQAGPSYPEELVVYPNPEPTALHSGARAPRSVFAGLALALAGVAAMAA